MAAQVTINSGRVLSSGNWAADFWTLPSAQKTKTSDEVEFSEAEKKILKLYFLETCPKHSVSDRLKSKILKWLDGEKVSFSEGESFQKTVVLLEALYPSEKKRQEDIAVLEKKLRDLKEI